MAFVLILGIALVGVAFGLFARGLLHSRVRASLALRSIALATAATPSTVAVEVDAESEHQLIAEHIIAYRLDGALFFGAAQRFLTELTNVTGTVQAKVDVTGSAYSSPSASRQSAGTKSAPRSVRDPPRRQ